MQESKVMNPQVADREIVLSRLINAPRERVFKAWVDPELVIKWWGPNGFTTTTQEMEVKPGGVWRFIMHGPDGRDYANKIVFIEILKPERLVYKHSGGGDTEDVKFHVTVTFQEQDGKTFLTIQSVFESAEVLDRVVKEYGAIEGGKQHLERLDKFLSESI
jgi:uncharacterized protein YndB with AHSA1/START domain